MNQLTRAKIDQDYVDSTNLYKLPLEDSLKYRHFQSVEAIFFSKFDTLKFSLWKSIKTIDDRLK